MIKIVIVDDQPVLLRGLKLLLAAESDMEVVGQATCVEEAVAVCCRQLPDVALVDGEIGGCGPLTATEALRAHCPVAQVIVFGLYDDPETRLRAAAAGAVSFVAKQAPLDVLAAIRKAAGQGSANAAC